MLVYNNKTFEKKVNNLEYKYEEKLLFAIRSSIPQINLML